MKHLLVGLLIAGAIAACLAWPRSVYGQRPVPRQDPLATWRQTSEGMSTNAALAFYRLRNNSATNPRLGVQNSPLRSPAPGVQVSPYQTRPPLRPTKPFEGVQLPPTGFERYWPLLLEGREDPKTGIIIWSIP